MNARDDDGRDDEGNEKQRRKKKCNILAWSDIFRV